MEDLFITILLLLQFKTYHPSRNLKFNNLGISQSLKLGNSLAKIFQAKFTSNFGLLWVELS